MSRAARYFVSCLQSTPNGRLITAAPYPFAKASLYPPGRNLPHKEIIIPRITFTAKSVIDQKARYRTEGARGHEQETTAPRAVKRRGFSLCHFLSAGSFAPSNAKCKSYATNPLISLMGEIETCGRFSMTNLGNSRRKCGIHFGSSCERDCCRRFWKACAGNSFRSNFSVLVLQNLRDFISLRK